MCELKIPEGYRIVICAAGFPHGAGKSTLAEELRKILERLGYSVKRTSAGDIFRDIASRSGKSIEEFISELSRDPNKSAKIDIEVDRVTMEKILNPESLVLIIDSNLGPFIAHSLMEHGKVPKDLIIVNILVYTDPRIAAERVFKKARYGDYKYKNVEQTLSMLLERTREDGERYKRLYSICEDKVLKRAYELGGEFYSSSAEEILKKDVTAKVFNVIVNNSGKLEDSVKSMVEQIASVLEKYAAGT